MENKYNALPVNSGWAFDKDAQRLSEENRETYEALCEVCTFSERPIGGKVSIKKMAPAYKISRYAVVSNPIGLDTRHIALFCDRGSLVFGYRVSHAIIEVYED